MKELKWALKRLIKAADATIHREAGDDTAMRTENELRKALHIAKAVIAKAEGKAP